jgi:hypothetical protein
MKQKALCFYEVSFVSALAGLALPEQALLNLNLTIFENCQI